jgi:hypothetical protein
MQLVFDDFGKNARIMTYFYPMMAVLAYHSLHERLTIAQASSPG